MKATEQYFPVVLILFLSEEVVTLNAFKILLYPFVTLSFPHRNTRVLHTDPMPLQDTVPIVPWPSRSSWDCCLENTGEVLSRPGSHGAPETSRLYVVCIQRCRGFYRTIKV